MSFFDKIVNRITDKFKKAQNIGEVPIEEVDEAIDRSHPQVQPQIGELSPEQVTFVVTKAREFLNLVDPLNPYDSPLPVLPSAFKNPRLMPYFIQTANYILKTENGMNSDVVDGFVKFLLGTGARPQVQEVVEPQIEPQQVIDPNEGIEPVKELARTEDPRLTEDIKRKLSENDLVDRLKTDMNVNPDLVFQGIEELDRRLGEGAYTIGKKHTSKQSKAGIQPMDRYPIKWNSPESQQFLDSYFKDEAIDTRALASRAVGEVKRYLKSKNLGAEIVGQDIDNLVWESMNTVDNISLGRTQRFNPKTGESNCVGKDYLIGFFTTYPQYLPENISTEYTKKNKKSWDLRDQLSPIMSSLIADKNRDVLNYIFKNMSRRIGNMIIDRVPKDQLSYDVESVSGKAFKDILDDRGGKMSERGAVVDKRSEEYRKALNSRTWGIMSQFASKENDGQGNVFRGAYDNLGKSAVDAMTDDIVEMDDPIKIITKNKMADVLQMFMLYGSNQVDELVKPVSKLKNDNGKIILDLKGNKVKSWGSLIYPGSLYNTLINVAKAKKYIATNYPAGEFRGESNDESRIGSVTSNIFKQNQVNDTVLYDMLADENFIKRSRLVDVNAQTKETQKRPAGNALSQSYGFFDQNLDLATYNKIAKDIRGWQGHFLKNSIPYLLQSAIDKKRDILANSDNAEAELARFRIERQFLGDAHPKHSYYKKDNPEEGRAVGGNRSEILSTMFGRDVTPREGWLMVTGQKEIPLEEVQLSREEAIIDMKKRKKASEEFINGLYKSGNSILMELVKAQQMLDGFDLGEEAIKTINKVGDDYRSRIESLRE